MNLQGLGALISIEAAGIALLSFKEGHESFQKARGSMICCDCKDNCN